MRKWFVTASAALALSGLAIAQTEPAPLIELRVDFERWKELAGETHLDDLWNEPSVVQFRQSLTESINQQIGSDLGLSLDDFKPFLSGQLAVQVNMPPMMMGPPTGALVHQFPEGEAESVEQMLRGLALQNQVPEDMLNTFLVRDGNTIALSPDVMLRDSLKGEFPLNLEGTTCLQGTFNIEPLVGMAQMQIANQDPNAHQILQQLGFFSLRRIDLTSGFEGGGSWAEMNVEGVNAEQGVWRFVGDPVVPAVLDLTPQGATSVTGGSMAPPAEMYDFLVGIMESNLSEFERNMFQQSVDQMNTMLGMNVRDELLPAIGSEWGFISGSMMGFSVNAALTVEVNDPAVVDRFISTVATQISQRILGDMGTMNPTISQIAVGDLQCKTMMIPGMPFQLMWTNIGDQMVLTTSQMQMNDIAQAVASGNTILDRPEFAGFADEISTPSTFVALSDQKAQFSQVQGMLSMMMMPLMGDPNVPAEMTQLVSLIPVLGPHLGQVISVGRIEGDSLNVRSVNNTGVGMDMTTGLVAIPVLASIAVPNFIEAQTRSKVSRVRADMRSMATALEAYYIDNNTYPANLNVTTTPIAYITSIPGDPFNDNMPIAYHQSGNGWILFSPGPDGVVDLDPAARYQEGMSYDDPALVEIAFDPTNGTVSSGDLYRTKQ